MLYKENPHLHNIARASNETKKRKAELVEMAKKSCDKLGGYAEFNGYAIFDTTKFKATPIK